MTDHFAERLLTWHAAHGRHDLPWQHDPTPYRVWVSEIMLQQTQVATVVPYYQRFVARFPSAQVLAGAHLDEVLALWSGLGYYSRARNLHAAACVIATEHRGVFPDTLDAVMALPGIGRSTAGAILALAQGQRHPILDGNCKRVLARFHAVAGWPGESAVAKTLWQHANTHTPDSRVAAYTQAIMDLGATVCTRSRPRCNECPLSSDCCAHATGTQETYPGKRSRKPLPVRQTCMLVLMRDDGVVLLQRRPPSGIWGGLWSLPECEEPAVMEQCIRQLGYSTRRQHTLSSFRHTFSHYHLDITPVLVRVRETNTSIMECADNIWAELGELADMGLPAPVRRLLEGLLEEPSWQEPLSA